MIDVVHIEKPGQDHEGAVFFLCGSFCTISSEGRIQQPGVDFVCGTGPWRDQPTCARCVSRTTALARRRAVTA